MHILLTGATGYIAQRLLPVLLEQGHQVSCLVRNSSRFDSSKFDPKSHLNVIEADLMDSNSLKNIPSDIDVAYYLVHSMSSGNDFGDDESTSARNFSSAIDQTNVQQVIFLSGIVNSSDLSKHLMSRKNVEDILRKGNTPLTTLRAGIIVGSGSASFEIMRDLVEKLPIMIAPKWLHTKCQPIAIRNVIEFLAGVLLKVDTYDQHFDIYGPDILSYREMLLQFAEERKLKRRIFIVPVMTPRLSSYWLYFVTSTSYTLARNLVDSMHIDVVAKPNNLATELSIDLIPYRKAIQLAFEKIEQNMVLSSWYDAMRHNYSKEMIEKQLAVPTNGVFVDHKSAATANVENATSKIFAIGGRSGWYYGNWLWSLRGHIDKLFGGIGLGRRRKNNTYILTGESLDFWRVIYSNREEKRLLLYAEMRLPGEAWLEFKVVGNVVQQTATFRPLGIAGRLYWYAVLPFHYFIFNGMIKKIAN